MEFAVLLCGLKMRIQCPSSENLLKMEEYKGKMPWARMKSDFVSNEIKKRRRSRFLKLAKADRPYCPKVKIMEDYKKKYVQMHLDIPV